MARGLMFARKQPVPAYIDGELGGAETRILEEHLSCGVAAARSANSGLYGADGPVRPAAGLGIRTRAGAFTEMEPAPHMHSHPTDPQHTRPRGNNLPWAVLGMAAAIVLVVTAFLYNGNTESARAVSNPVGMVAFSDGNGVLRMSAGDDEYERAALKSLVAPGDRFETLSDGRLAFALIGASLVKVNHGSELLVEDNRRIRVDRGETLFDVGRDRRKFSVDTPAGEIRGRDVFPGGRAGKTRYRPWRRMCSCATGRARRRFPRATTHDRVSAARPGAIAVDVPR